MIRGRTLQCAMLAAQLVAIGSVSAHAQSIEDIDDVVRQGIKRGIYPGAVVVIGRRDSVLYARGYGHFTWSPTSPAPSPDSTLWDIASITKVVGTTGAAMRLVDSGRLQLDAPVRLYLPRFAGGAKNAVTVRMLLDHTSGLRAYVPFFKQAKTRDAAISILYSEPLIRSPGEKPVYSDLNAILLGLLLESVSGMPLERLVAREVFNPLQLSETSYNLSS